ncbi:hypothetical protein AUQ02_12640 [Escherichia coli]|uniref:hypothetical protein n=2 Tax=Escherichia coli TaxID=562 RepID=UPI00066BFCA3|nr:hypothetical protein MJ49_26950 [Escherichia coli]EBM0706668.1 hypothetical protein [Salmonella enterica subsp. enterica serovar Heidelberg]EDE3584241.1 hypothetical protein [Salmonella enterica subsp. enterica serovar Typhimurium]HBY9035492.1 hypothetical protein [Klebsiella pneumoniae]EBN3406235.1 hypothetical protein [Salmonella enterica subsp. enterica serovar Heidelberg]
MLPSETMIWQPEFTDKTLSRKPGAVQNDLPLISGEKKVFSRIQVISFFAVHIPACISLGQGAGTISSIIFPLQCFRTRCVGYGFVKIILRLLTEEVLSGDDPVIA